MVDVIEHMWDMLNKQVLYTEALPGNLQEFLDLLLTS